MKRGEDQVLTAGFDESREVGEVGHNDTEESAAYLIDTHDAADASVAGLGFATCIFNGEAHDYFIAWS